MPTKKIAWENWDSDVLEQEVTDAIFESEDFEDEEAVEDAILFLGKIPKLVTTPTGVYQLHDKMNILNQFDCWMGHTNFDLTKSVEKVIESIEGVELLTVIGRYRFFIGIGKLFSFSDVRRTIENILCDSISHEDFDDILENEIEDNYRSLSSSITNLKLLLTEYKHWALFIGSDGMVDYTMSNQDNDAEYLEMIEEYEKYKKEYGGTILRDKVNEE
tara:strand:+ start:3259 stop:3909 length:651 start_codon:yes stop_codon:yes gene_type:complete